MKLLFSTYLPISGFFFYNRRDPMFRRDDNSMRVVSHFFHSRRKKLNKMRSIWKVPTAAYKGVSLIPSGNKSTGSDSKPPYTRFARLGRSDLLPFFKIKSASTKEKKRDKDRTLTPTGCLMHYAFNELLYTLNTSLVFPCVESSVFALSICNNV